MIAGTDCGFAQAQGIQRVHPPVMWAKFESLAEGARLASKELWVMNIGFVGLGAMGVGIVPRLMAAGHTVTGWNRSKDKAEPLIKAGMRFAATPRAVAAALARSCSRS